MSAPIRLQPLGDSIKKDWDTNIIDFKGYNGSPNLKKSGIKVGFTQDMVDEWIRCRDDPIYFAETYIKIVHVDRGLIPIELYEYQKEVIDVVQGNRKIIVTQSRQSGKALCLDTEIPMSAGGFKRMGDIVVGDSVIGNDGKPVMVTFVSEIHNKPSYRITFSDGSTIKACEDHLWEVNNNQVLSTKELAKNIQTSRFFIPATAPVEYPQIELDFDPYFLGQFVIDVNTPIPDEYLYSSIDDRVALLRGLLCSHENIYRNKGVLEFSLPQENGVIHQIKQLIESLGIVVCIHKKYTRKIDVIHTVISFSEHELLKFSNPLWNIQKKVRYITKVERIDNIPTKCISVNNKNHMFLCGRQYIPTHNTTVATCIILHYILFNQHKTVALLANKGDAALEIMSRIQLAYEYLPKWLQSGIITWNKGSIELENGCKILASATSGSAIRGKSCVSGDTVVTVRNKETGEINDIRIDEISIPFDTIEIYDGEEFRDFHEIRIQKKELFVIQCENGVIKATDDHEFLLESDEWVKVSDLNEHHILKLAGAFKYKKSIGIDDVYDPIHVEVSHQYKSNNFISHNCSLVYIDECVVGDTLITVRDKETGVVSILPIREIHTTDHLLLENTKYEVLTASGFQSFSGSKKTDGKILSMFFSDASSLECTLSHKILMAGDVFEEAHNICIGDVTSTGLSVIDIKYDQKVESVYDLLDVCNGNAYLTNGVVSHNCAFVEHFDEFYSSVYPTIASGKDTKILFTSTPNGLNFFYKFWTEAKEERNGFKWVEVAWDKVPGRDDAWKIETLSGMNHDYEQFEVEFNCQFAGSSGTLLSGSSLKALVHQTPIYEWEGFTQYHEPIKEEAYVMLCDVSRGKGLDYSAFQVINVTKMPYVQVATFRSNTITPTDYAHVINKIGTLYNTASVLVENNDIGGQVADMLFDDLDYENLLFTESNGKAGKVLCGGGSKAEPSIRTTTSVKAKGCSVLKLLIEQQQLIINDFNTINELSRFSKKGKSYEAEDGHDDMVMGLVLFAWITTQPYFSNITDVNTLSNLRDNNTQWDECIPFGFIVDGREDDNLVEIDDSGNAWMKTDAWHMNY